MKKIRSYLQHYGNSRHIYCRLCSVLPCQKAKAIAIWWEHHIQVAFYFDLFSLVREANDDGI